MIVTCVANSALKLLLEPESVIERAFLEEMAGRSEKGATTVLALPKNGENVPYTVEVSL
jgi:hypothetical protein